MNNLLFALLHLVLSISACKRFVERLADPEGGGQLMKRYFTNYVNCRYFFFIFFYLLYIIEGLKAFASNNNSNPT